MTTLARTYSGETWPLLPRPRVLRPGEQHAPAPVPTEEYVELLERDNGILQDEIEVLEGRVTYLQERLAEAGIEVAELQGERASFLLAGELAAIETSDSADSGTGSTNMARRHRLAMLRAESCDTRLSLVDLGNGLSFDVPAHRLVRDNDVVRVGPTSYLILVALVEARGRVVTTSSLVERLWQGTMVGEQAANVLRTRLWGLRSKLRSFGSGDLITTVPRIGYRLEAST